jgi:hypothetical protein
MYYPTSLSILVLLQTTTDVRSINCVGSYQREEYKDKKEKITWT